MKCLACCVDGTGQTQEETHAALTAIILMTAATALGAPARAQQTPNQTVQDQADKGIKTQNSGASGYVADQEKSGA